jgi:hypothetical protein
MSGISKPLVNCSTSNQPLQQINVDAIRSMDKYQVGTDPNNAASQEVGIMFTMDLNSPQRTIKLTYPGATAAAIILRDASFAAVETLLANTTV